MEPFCEFGLLVVIGCQYVSDSVSRCQYVSVNVSMCQYVSVHVTTCQYMSNHVNHVNPCQYKVCVYYDFVGIGARKNMSSHTMTPIEAK